MRIQVLSLRRPLPASATAEAHRGAVPVQPRDDDRRRPGRRSSPRPSATAAPTGSSAPTPRRRSTTARCTRCDRAARRQRQCLADDGGQPRASSPPPRPAATSRCSPTACRAVSCGALPCLDNNWAQPDNVFFIAELISRQKATGLVDDDRVHLVGFSGGAKLIYDVVATPGFPHAIDSVATVAGAFGLFHADRPEEGFSVTQLQQGTPGQRAARPGRPRRPPAGRRRPRRHRARVPRLVPHQGRLLAARHRHRSRRRRRRSTCWRSTRRRRPTSPPSATPMPA